jgi:hypothetical protein
VLSNRDDPFRVAIDASASSTFAYFMKAKAGFLENYTGCTAVIQAVKSEVKFLAKLPV